MRSMSACKHVCGQVLGLLLDVTCHELERWSLRTGATASLHVYASNRHCGDDQHMS